MDVALWDTAGQDEYANIRRLSYPSTDVFVVCFSVVDRSSLENVRLSWLPELRAVTVYQCFSPARRYAGAGTSYGAVSVCLPVCLSVCLYIRCPAAPWRPPAPQIQAWRLTVVRVYKLYLLTYLLRPKA